MEQKTLEVVSHEVKKENFEHSIMGHVYTRERTIYEEFKFENGMSLVYDINEEDFCIKIILNDGTEIKAIGSECEPGIEINGKGYSMGEGLC